MVSTKCVLVAVVPFLKNIRILRSWFLSGKKSHGWFFRTSWRFSPYFSKIYFKHTHMLLSLTTIAAHALWTELTRRTPWRVGMGQNDTSESSALIRRGPFAASPKAGQLTYLLSLTSCMITHSCLLWAVVTPEEGKSSSLSHGDNRASESLNELPNQGCSDSAPRDSDFRRSEWGSRFCDADRRLRCEQLLYSVFAQPFPTSWPRQLWVGEF